MVPRGDFSSFVFLWTLLQPRIVVMVMTSLFSINGTGTNFNLLYLDENNDELTYVTCQTDLTVYLTVYHLFTQST